jgi:hypothetical protein
MTLIEAAKLALEALYPISHNSTDDYRGQADKAIDVLRTAIKAAEKQEPVAWVREHELPLAPCDAFSWVETLMHKTPLYTTPPAQRKPQYNKTEMNCFVQNLYDEKMREGKHGHYETMFHVVHRAIEAAHGITGEKK